MIGVFFWRNFSRQVFLQRLMKYSSATAPAADVTIEPIRPPAAMASSQNRKPAHDSTDNADTNVDRQGEPPSSINDPAGPPLHRLQVK